MATERELPKVDGDILYSSETNESLGFGDGTDGAFSESADTTNLTQGTIYQYTSFLLDTNATLSATTTSDKPIIIYVQGNCTINGTISLAGKGCPTTFDGYMLMPVNVTGYAGPGYGTKGSYYIVAGDHRKGGTAGGYLFNFKNNQKNFIMNGTAGGVGGSTTSPFGDSRGGGGGASSTNDGIQGGAIGVTHTATAGVGGAGGCTIFIKIGGTLTFGANSSIDCSGADGSAGVGVNASGGGGGGSGDILIFHRGTKTDNGVTTDVTASVGGEGSGTSADGGAGAVGTVLIALADTIAW